MSLSIHIPQFEGPLGLLLYLIRKEEMDIFDIDVHLITSQYLEYIKKMKEFDLEMAGDFIAMAATLIQIKSKMLLPNYNEEDDDEIVEDPRKELVKRLLEYQQFQEASKKIYDRPLLGRDVFKRGGKSASFLTDEEGEIILDEGGLFSLIALYRGSIRKMKRAVHRVANKTRSIAGRILEIKDRLIIGHKVLLKDLIQSVDDMRSELLITFLSMLELGKMGAVSVYQSENYGDIYIQALKPIDGSIVSRVEEYDSINADVIADRLMDKANEEIQDRDEGDDDLPLMQARDDEDEGEEEVASFDMATDLEIEEAELDLNIENVDEEPQLDGEPT